MRFICKLDTVLLLNSRSVIFGSVSVFVSLMMLVGSAYGYNAKVTIVNESSNHCMPYPSCYMPYEVVISPGDTVTWLNGDNRTHTATTGTTNYGPQGVFDSGSIPPNGTYTQFFGSIGKYQYYDKTDMWPSGIVLVKNQKPTNAQLGWVNGSLVVTDDVSGQGLAITKEVENTGGTDAHSIIFRLKIHNDTGFLFYDDIVKTDVPARQSAPISFVWHSPHPGVYRLDFNAAAGSFVGDSNENNDASSDIISVSKIKPNQNEYLVGQNFTLSSGGAMVPEYGAMSYVVLGFSVLFVVVISVRLRIPSNL